MQPEEHANKVSHPTETTPLLSRIQAAGPVDPNAPGGPLAGLLFAARNGTEEANGKPAGDEDALERQASMDGTQEHKQPHDNVPEIRDRMRCILPAMAIGIFLCAADQTIIISSYGQIGSELNALNRTSWIATAYLLTLTSFQPLYGRLSDIFGRKTCLLFGYAIFGIGCLGCGLAEDITQLIAARAFAGIGSSAMTTVVSILMSDAVPLRERGTWQGYINLIYAAGSSAGAPLGGILADYVGWRWAFLGQVPLCAVAFVAVTFTLHLPNPEMEHVDWRKKFARVDFLGVSTLIAAVFSLLFSLDRGSNLRWTAPIALVPLGISISLFITFVLVETELAKEPIAPYHIIFNRTMLACYLCNFFSMASWLSALFYIPLYFQTVDHLSATGAGLRLIPSVVLGVSGSLFAGVYMQRTGRYYALTILAYTSLALGMVLIFHCSGPVIHSSAAIIVGMCIAGFSNGIGITTTLIAIIANAPHEDQAVATACSYLFRSLGSVFGVSSSATIANQALRDGLSSALPRLGLPEEEAYEIADRVRQSLAYLGKLGPEVQNAVAKCYARSTTAAFAVQAGLLVGAAGCAWFIKEKVLSR